MIGIIADVHGNYPALYAVMESLRNKKCSKIYCLGDTAGYYCMINESIELLKKNNVIGIRGNHDTYLLGEGECPRSNSVNKTIQYQKKVIKRENLQWIESLPEIVISEEFVAVHGGWNNYLDEYITNFSFDEEKLKQFKKNLFLSGHTHVQAVQKAGNMIYCNPGSVGQPRDNNPKAAYAVINDNKVELHRTPYNINEIQYQMKEAGFCEYFYENLSFGRKIGG